MPFGEFSGVSDRKRSLNLLIFCLKLQFRVQIGPESVCLSLLSGVSGVSQTCFIEAVSDLPQACFLGGLSQLRTNSACG